MSQMEHPAIAARIRDGLIAGFVGTALLTLAQEAERRLRGREQGSLAAEIGAKLFGLRPGDQREVARLSHMVHWSYGTISGVAYGVLSLLALPGPVATLIHFGLVWTGDTALLIRLGLAPPPWRCFGEETVTHLFYRLVLAVATTSTYHLLARSRRREGNMNRPLSGDP